MQESFVTADVIGNMIIGPGAGGAIVQSQIWATERIDSAVIVGDTVDSRIFASPVVVGDTGDGPMALAEGPASQSAESPNGRSGRQPVVYRRAGAIDRGRAIEHADSVERLDRNKPHELSAARELGRFGACCQCPAARRFSHAAAPAGSADVRLAAAECRGGGFDLLPTWKRLRRARNAGRQSPHGLIRQERSLAAGECSGFSASLTAISI